MQHRHEARPAARALKTAHGQSPGINAQESPLGWLAGRKSKDGRPLIDREEFEAGERLRRDFHISMLAQKVTSSWSGLASDPGARRSMPGAGVDLADSVIAARERVNRALSAVGPELASVLVDVCCYLKGLETLEKSAGWPQRSAKIVLQIALQALARHYGILRSTNAPMSEHRATMRHWGASDYRPRVDRAED